MTTGGIMKNVSFKDYLKQQGRSNFSSRSELDNQYKYLYDKVFGRMYDCPYCDNPLQPLAVDLNTWDAQSKCPTTGKPIRFSMYGIISGEWGILPITK